LTHFGREQSRKSAHNRAILTFNFPEPRGCVLSNEHVERRLAAILAADVAGSCRLIGIDEEGALARLKALRKALFDPKISEHRGRIVKNTGDGALVEFASVVDAVRCAVEIQRGMAEQNIDVQRAERIEFRIGIHLGDIIVDESDIYGDGVNIAVRLEGIAEPGGVSISDDVYRQIRGKVDFIVEDIGWRSLKNIANPMRVWRFRISGAARSVAPRTSRMTRRLAAILVADVASFTSLVKANETDALERLGALRYEIIEPNITQHAGRLVRATGDGFLAEFPSAVQAVACAIAIQAETEQAAAALDDNAKMRLRVGVHVGEVMTEGDDLAGESVYITSRLENITAPGGISISRAVHDQVRDRINARFDDKGEIPLKNIVRPMQVFGVSSAKQSKTTGAD
jgi:class 3 adenylate cyclase